MKTRQSQRQGRIIKMNRYKFENNNKSHLHLLDGRPLTGVSSVGAVISKPLTYWAAGLAVAEFGWLNPKKHTPEECAVACEEGLERIKKLERDEYAKLLDKAYRAHASTLKEKASEGTDRHELVEGFVREALSSSFAYSSLS